MTPHAHPPSPETPKPKCGLTAEQARSQFLDMCTRTQKDCPHGWTIERCIRCVIDVGASLLLANRIALEGATDANVDAFLSAVTSVTDEPALSRPDPSPPASRSETQAEVARLNRIVEDFRREQMEIKELLGLAAGGVGRSLVEELRAALAHGEAHAAAPKEKNDGQTRSELPAAVSEVRTIQLQPHDERQLGATMQAEQKSSSKGSEGVQGLAAHAAAGSEKDEARPPRFVEKVCPFCGENDFDAWGLKFHLSQGGCDIYNETTREQR